MLRELNIARSFLTEKFGRTGEVEPGEYSVPIDTSKGPAFMKVIITPELDIKGFDLFKDEKLTESWHN